MGGVDRRGVCGVGGVGGGVGGILTGGGRWAGGGGTRWRKLLDPQRSQRPCLDHQRGALGY